MSKELNNELGNEPGKEPGKEPEKAKKTTTRFSDFIRYASPAEKARVYAEVMRKATESQDKLLQKKS